ncbi:hypothetical protein SKAU_G00005000 [Synaphobranchus kaupii]|uniref:Myb-like domain-containing protein n=1 Tax=Synaphobranchus kaupii TaxID=118154 RepID=A0A9Q1JCS1_SYNKA|nr:hypothetical protein SKAU_G00005000 [Synaphobranchus kaupii]
MIVLQMNPDSPLMFMDTPEDDWATGHRLVEMQHSEEKKGEKKQKKKKHKRHAIEGAEVEMAEQDLVQELGVDCEQAQGIEVKKKKKQHKQKAEDYGASTDVNGNEEQKKNETEPRMEVICLGAFEQEEQIPRERKKKSKSSCGQTESRAQCETVAGVEDGASVSKPDEQISEQTPREVLQDWVKKKKKKRRRREESSEQTDLSTQGETEDGTEDGTEASQQGEETPRKNKSKKKGKGSSDQTEFRIQVEIDGTESSQRDEQISEQVPTEIQQERKRRRKKRRESNSEQTESDIQGEIEDGVEDDAETSKRREVTPERSPQDGKRKSNSGQMPPEKNRKKSRLKSRSDQTESSIEVEAVAGVKDGAEASRLGGISMPIPPERTKAKDNKRKRSRDQKKNERVSMAGFMTELDEHTLDIEQWGEHWEEEKLRYLDELREFMPGVENKSTYMVYKHVKYDLLRFRDFRKAGVRLKHGRYSKDELNRLKKNVEDFLALTGIDSATKLFFPNRFPQERPHIVKTKSKYRFHLRMSDGICRPWHNIYHKGRKLYDMNKVGRFTDEELHQLQKLHQLHGNKWMKIAELTDRSCHSLEKRFSQMSTNKGPWSDDELQRLEEALRDHLVKLAKPSAKGPTIRRDQLYSNLPWTEVALTVGTRSWDKCRFKWMAVLKKRMAVQMEDHSGSDMVENIIRLIRELYMLEIEDAGDINWEDLTQIFGDVTPHFVQIKFHKLKVKYVPRWQVLSFGDVIDFLYEKTLPQLEEQLRDHVDTPARETEDVSTQQESFLLSQIFSDLATGET